MVDTRRTRDLGVAIARVLMQVNLIGESRALDLPTRVRSLVRTPAGNPQGIEDGFDLTVGGTPTIIARVLTDHLHAMLTQTLDIYLDEFAFDLVGHAIGKLLGIEVVYLRVIRSTGGVHGIGLFDCIGFGFELLDIIKNFICFSVEQAKAFKILAGYHQYFAVRKAVEKAKIATKTDGKGGVFWHTQGSGKSLSMVFYAHLLQEALDSSTIVVMTDRIDLDDQLYSQFSKCAAFLCQTPVQAESKVHLKELLDGRTANGIIFTTMFKFEEREEPLSTRRNIVVMADEAHRGQYGMDERVIMSENESGETEARIVVGNARIIRDALPNATFIGFTGTPVSSKDRNTREVFGDYIDIYDMTQAVEDGATRPVYYESRVIHLKLDENTLALIDSTYDILAQQADETTIEKSKKMMGQMESVLGADSTIACVLLRRLAVSKMLLT